MATTAESDSEAVKSGSAATEDLQSTISNVQSQIDLLADLNQRLQTLRQLPGGVLRSELVLGSNQVLQTLTLKDIFGKSAEDLQTLHAAALEGKMQDALRAAAESERRDKTAIKDAPERETQKKSCVSTLQTFARTFLLLLPYFSPCKRGRTVHDTDRGYPPPFFFSIFFVLQPISHPRIPETVSAVTAEGRESVPPASCGCDATHAQRPAVIHPGVQLNSCEEGAAAHLLGSRARITGRCRSCCAQVPDSECAEGLHYRRT
jgi:hypothetical protein